jgi:hypothetical protein
MSLAMYREMQADQWYEGPSPTEEMPGHALDITTDSNRRNGNGLLPKVSAAFGSGAV